MKNLSVKLAIMILISILGLNFSIAKNPSYKLTAENLKVVAPNVMEFDIYLLNTNLNEAEFRYILGQYYFEFNPDIANGGTLTYSLVSSDLPSSLQPRNPNVSGNQLRLVTNSVPSKENLPVISDVLPGTLIARVRLETSAKIFSDASLDLKLRVGPDNPYTKVMAYINNQIIDITNEEGVSSDNLSEVNSVNTEIPQEFALRQNYPNPFNPSTSIKFDVPVLSNAKLSIYDVTGKELAVLVNQELQAGSYEYNWNASQFASGIYFYRIKAGSFVQTKRMVLIK